jgi:hypothetical protein
MQTLHKLPREIVTWAPGTEPALMTSSLPDYDNIIRGLFKHTSCLNLSSLIGCQVLFLQKPFLGFPFKALALPKEIIAFLLRIVMNKALFRFVKHH